MFPARLLDAVALLGFMVVVGGHVLLIDAVVQAAILCSYDADSHVIDPDQAAGLDDNDDRQYDR